MVGPKKGIAPVTVRKRAASSMARRGLRDGGVGAMAGLVDLGDEGRLLYLPALLLLDIAREQGLGGGDARRFRELARLVAEGSGEDRRAAEAEEDLLRRVARRARRQKISPTAAAIDLYQSASGFARARKRHPKAWAALKKRYRLR